MLRVRPLSDLHFEFHRDAGRGFVDSLDAHGIDLLVLAGDIFKMRHGFYRMLKMFRDHFSCPIVWVHGNHEFHESSRAEVVQASRDAISHLRGVYWLDNDVLDVKVNDKTYRVLGTPLWFHRPKAPKHPMLLSTNQEWANGIIRSVTKKGVVKTMYPDFEAIAGFSTWVYAEAVRARRFLEQNLREGDVLVTHFLPTRHSISEAYRGALSNDYFVHDLTDLLLERKPALVLHGHTHSSFDYRLEGSSTRVVCNPFGYVSKGEVNASFDENMTVVVGE